MAGRQQAKSVGGVKRVLVVDDDAESLAFACKALEPGYTVFPASCAADALRIAREAGPDLAVLDVIMQGGENGFAILRELAGDSSTAHIPVIFLTSVNEATGLAFGPAELSRYLGCEPAAFLEKPVAAERLRAEVAAVLQRTLRSRAGRSRG